MKDIDPHMLDRLCVLAASISAHPYMQRYREIRRAVHHWMFATGTRGIEILNVGALAIWAAALLDDRLLALSVYIGAHMLLHPLANEALAGLFALATLVQLAGLLRRDPAADKLTSWGLQVGAVLWFGVSLNFLASYPPITTGVGTYLLLAFLTWSAGCYLRDD